MKNEIHLPREGWMTIKIPYFQPENDSDEEKID